MRSLDKTREINKGGREARTHQFNSSSTIFWNARAIALSVGESVALRLTPTLLAFKYSTQMEESAIGSFL